ncbi:DNA polymerase III subunit chi [Pseudohaliea rubra]|uniref:DNA polymerase III chi subunit n=1 Tax=Pseudohaliea rubra DSM 19751 TaxID=1265313 RepID=A0A095XZW3_9GAMM|nr:DNA polymerase III subunit chi [Pseudohaliea rubra]KGE05326.1 DNA polymerase III chi subunit [Pseudohaliea rubra DSM 19751]
MTRVGFYVVSDGDAGRRPLIACRLAHKAAGRGHRVFLHCADETQARGLDELLWNFRPDAFLPHALVEDHRGETVLIGWGQDPADHDDLLINLDLTPPPFFPRFHRVAEVVTRDETSLQALRAAWQFYRERGYALEKHDL